MGRSRILSVLEAETERRERAEAEIARRAASDSEQDHIGAETAAFRKAVPCHASSPAKRRGARRALSDKPLTEAISTIALCRT